MKTGYKMPTFYNGVKIIQIQRVFVATLVHHGAHSPLTVADGGQNLDDTMRKEKKWGNLNRHKS